MRVRLLLTGICMYVCMYACMYVRTSTYFEVLLYLFVLASKHLLWACTYLVWVWQNPLPIHYGKWSGGQNGSLLCQLEGVRARLPQSSAKVSGALK